MGSIGITIPDEMISFVEGRIRQMRHTTPQEYIQSLILDDQKRAERESLELKLMEGMNSGDPVDATSEKWWERKRRDLAGRLKGKRT